MKNSKKVYFLMIAVLAIGVLAIATDVYFGNKYLSNRSKKIVELKLENQKLDQQLSSLSRARKDVEKYEEYNDIAKQIVPQDKDEVRAIREIYELASESGVSISSVSLPVSTLGQKTAATPSASTGTDSASSANSSGTKPSTPSVSQATPVEGISGILQLKLIVTPRSSGYTYDQFLDFLDKLEKNRRTAQITKVTINRVDNSDRLNFNLELAIYLKPAGAK